jgi:hypothetical protein
MCSVRAALSLPAAQKLVPATAPVSSNAVPPPRLGGGWESGERARRVFFSGGDRYDRSLAGRSVRAEACRLRRRAAFN